MAGGTGEEEGGGGGGRTGIKIWGTENQEAAVEGPSEVGQSKLDYLYFENKY